MVEFLCECKFSAVCVNTKYITRITAGCKVISQDRVQVNVISGDGKDCSSQLRPLMYLNGRELWELRAVVVEIDDVDLEDACAGFISLATHVRCLNLQLVTLVDLPVKDHVCFNDSRGGRIDDKGPVDVSSDDRVGDTTIVTGVIVSGTDLRDVRAALVALPHRGRVTLLGEARRVVILVTHRHPHRRVAVSAGTAAAAAGSNHDETQTVVGLVVQVVGVGDGNTT